MKTLLLTLSFLLIFSITSYAEIAHFSNDFTGSQIIISVNERSKSENHYKTFNTIAFRKEIIQSKPSYKLFLITSTSQTPSTLDKTNFKFNDNKILSLKTNVEYNSVPRPVAYNLDAEFINKILLTNSIQVQIPLFTHDKSQIKYLEYTIPTTALEEWKQVITME